MDKNKMVPVAAKYLREYKQFTFGAYGNIYKGYTRIKKKPVILKQCSRAHKYAMREIKILNSTGNHKNIVRMLDYEYEDECIWMMLEYCNIGELYDYCKRNKPNLAFTIDVIRQSAAGLHYLHTLPTPVIHRDVQPRNILLHKEKYLMRVKLCDFGLSKLGDDEVPADTYMVSSEVGQDYFKAPEMIDMTYYNVTLDTFSLGLCLESMFHFGQGKSSEFLPVKAFPPNGIGVLTFGKFLSKKQRNYSIVKHDRNDNAMHQMIKTFIDEMTQFDYKARPDMAKVTKTLDLITRESDGFQPDGAVGGIPENINIGTTDLDSGLASLADGIRGMNVRDLRIPVIKGSRHVRTHKLQRKYCSIWSTQDPGILAIGGAYECVITLIHEDGDILKDNNLDVKDADKVNSGVHLYASKHAIITRNRGNFDVNSHKLVILDLNNTRYTGSIIQYIDLIKPVKVFNISDEEFGVLSWGDRGVLHINVYDKTTYHHKSTTNIRYPDAYTDDSICPSPGGGWCVGSGYYHKVHVFSHDGELLEALGTPAGKPHMDKPGLLYYPYSVHVDVDGGIVVTCVYGQVHRYSDKIWSILTTLKPVWGMFVTGSKIYTVWKDQFNVYNIEI